MDGNARSREEGYERLLRERGYRIQHTLGEGAYSKVKSAHSSRLGRDVAIKCINSELAPRDFVEKFLPRELKTLPLLRHSNIVRVYEILEASDGYVYIVMEAARNGDMLRYVQRHGALPESEIRQYFWQLCQAINYCHRHNICHRDLKCENLLLAEDNKLLLTDFGFSKPMSYDSLGRISLSSTFCGSAAYAAPEIIQGRPYDPRMHDMWSMGVILYIMACGHMPFDDSNVKKMLKVQLRNHLRFPPRVADKLSDPLKHMIRSLIQPDVTQRATMEQMFDHPFLAGCSDEATRTSPLNPAASVVQHIYDFFTGRPSTTHTNRRGSVGNSDDAAAGCSTAQRRHHHHSNSERHHHHHHHQQHPPNCCSGNSSRDQYDPGESTPCQRRCRHPRGRKEGDT